MPTDPSRPVLLVVHPGSLGDVLLSLDAVRALRDAWPTHEMILLARGDVGTLLQACGEVDRAVPIEGTVLAQLLAGGGAFDPGVATWLQRCTVVVCWMKDPGVLERTLRKAGIGQIIAHSPHSPTLQAVHVRDRYFEILHPWGIRPGDAVQALRVPEPLHPDHSLAGAAGRGATIAVHPGSGSPAKCCDPRRLANAIQVLHTRGRRSFLVLSGPADDVHTTRLFEHLDGVRASRIQNHDLTAIAAILTKAHVFIGQDSGVTHLAAALGVPTIALFGPTDPGRWAPRGHRVVVLRGSSCACVGAEEIRHCQFRPCFEIPTEHIVDTVERCLMEHEAATARLPWSEKVC